MLEELWCMEVKRVGSIIRRLLKGQKDVGQWFGEDLAPGQLLSSTYTLQVKSVSSRMVHLSTSPSP